MTEKLAIWAVASSLLCTAALVSTAQADPVPLESATLQGDEVIQTPIGEIELIDNYVSDDAIQRLFDEMDYQRAAQAYIWATPAVSFKQWQVAQEETFGATGLGDFVVYNTLKEKRGIVTANLTTPYVINFVNLADGPIFVEVPAAPTAGMFLDAWQRPVSDIGQTGPDQAQGGTYIVVGPEHDAAEYEGQADFVVASETNNILFGVRILDPSPEVVQAVRDGLKVARVGDEPRQVNVIQNVDQEWSATAPRGLEFWKLLSDLYQGEPTREVDKAFAAMLEPLGIGKGIPFDPDERQRRILKRGAAMGELMLRNLQTNPRFAEPYWDGTNWYKSFDFTVPQITDERVELDERGVWFYEAVTSSEGMVNPPVGAGQVYMTTKRDDKGNLLRADENYRLHVPADVPVGQFWSLTLYSENTRRPYDNGGIEISDVSLGSQTEGVKYNEDGSIDLYVGPDAPEGLESNHLKTVGDDGWFVYFRLYGPEQPFFDKTFTLDDFEMVD